VQLLLSRFGKWGIYMHELAQGIDKSEVKEEECCKSISRETTFEEDTDNDEILNRTMTELAEDVHRSLVEEGFLFKTLTVKVRYKGFITRTRAHTFLRYMDDISTIKDTSKALLKPFIDGNMVRLIGIRLSKLEKRTGQKSMAEFE
jgi:DNA polymerase IV (DinB-like DNA polymerase)